MSIGCTRRFVRLTMRRASWIQPERRAMLELLDSIVAAAAVRSRTAARTMLAISSLTCLIVLLGVYGTQTYMLRQRLGELAVRHVLGATRKALVQSVLREALWTGLVGLSIGWVFAVVGAHLLRASLHGVPVVDPGGVLMVSSAITAGVLLASAPTARRAAGSNQLRFCAAYENTWSLEERPQCARTSGAHEVLAPAVNPCGSLTCPSRYSPRSSPRQQPRSPPRGSRRRSSPSRWWMRPTRQLPMPPSRSTDRRCRTAASACGPMTTAPSASDGSRRAATGLARPRTASCRSRRASGTTGMLAGYSRYEPASSARSGCACPVSASSPAASSTSAGIRWSTRRCARWRSRWRPDTAGS